MQIGHIMVMILVFGIQLHIKVAAVDAGLFHARHRRREPFKRKLPKHLKQALPRRVATQIQQRRNKHVPRDSRLAIQVERLPAPRAHCAQRHIHATPLGLNRNHSLPTLPHRMRSANKHPRREKRSVKTKRRHRRTSR